MAGLYNTKRWRDMRVDQLMVEPFCAFCTQRGIKTPATIADHITPHKNNPDLFFDPRNLQSLCKCCHDRHKQRLEKSGFLAGGDVQGNPLDPLHHWNRA